MILKLETILLLGIIFFAFWTLFCLTVKIILHLIKAENDGKETKNETKSKYEE